MHYLQKEGTGWFETGVGLGRDAKAKRRTFAFLASRTDEYFREKRKKC